MKTCLNCIHFGVCGFYREIRDVHSKYRIAYHQESKLYEVVASICRDFKEMKDVGN